MKAVDCCSENWLFLLLFFFNSSKLQKAKLKKSIMWHNDDSRQFIEECKPSAKERPDRSHTSLCLCATPPLSFMGKRKHVLGLRVSQMFPDSRGMGLCICVKYWSWKWKQEKPADSQGQWPFSEVGALWKTHPIFASVKETHMLFRVCIVNETKHRRKPAREYFRK